MRGTADLFRKQKIVMLRFQRPSVRLLSALDALPCYYYLIVCQLAFSTLRLQLKRDITIKLGNRTTVITALYATKVASNIHPIDFLMKLYINKTMKNCI